MEKECKCSIPNSWCNNSSFQKRYKIHVSNDDGCCCGRPQSYYTETSCKPFWQPYEAPHCIPECQPACNCYRQTSTDCPVKKSCNCSCKCPNYYGEGCCFINECCNCSHTCSNNNECHCTRCGLNECCNGALPKCGCCKQTNPPLAKCHLNLLEQMKEDEEREKVSKCLYHPKTIPRCCSPCKCSEKISLCKAIRVTREQGNTFGYYTSKKRTLNRPAVFKRSEAKESDKSSEISKASLVEEDKIRNKDMKNDMTDIATRTVDGGDTNKQILPKAPTSLMERSRSAPRRGNTVSWCRSSHLSPKDFEMLPHCNIPCCSICPRYNPVCDCTCFKCPNISICPADDKDPCSCNNPYCNQFN